MKILEVYESFLPNVGGTEIYIYDLCKYLIERGHNPIVLTWSPPKPSFEVISGIMVHRFWSPLLLQATRYLTLLYLSLQIMKLVRRYDIDIIHAHDYLHGIASALAGKLMRKPVVVTFHVAPLRYWPNLSLPAYVSPVEPILRKYFIVSVTAVTCISKFIYLEMRRHDFPFSKLKMLYEWTRPFPRCAKTKVDNVLEKFNLANKRYILSVGRLTEKEKPFSISICALKLLVKKGYDLHLAIAGDGPDRQALMKYSLKLGVADRVHFLGFVDRADLSCLYQECETLAHPARFEGLGFVLLEAMSFGKPVISTKVEGIPEVIENEYNGILVDLKPSAFASAIERLLLTPHLTEVFSKRSRRIVSEKFSMNNCWSTIYFLEKIAKHQTDC